MADRIITFEYASDNFNDYKKKSIPSTKQCMTKSKVIEYINCDENVLINYLNNQLIPIVKVVPTMDKIYIYAPILEVGNVGGNDTYAQSTAAKFYDFNGIRIYMNKNADERHSIVSQIKQNSINQKMVLFLSSYNISNARKIRLSYQQNVGDSSVYPNENYSVLKIPPYTKTVHGIAGRFVSGNRDTGPDMVTPKILSIPTNVTTEYYDFEEMHAYHYLPVNMLNSNNYSYINILVEILDSNNNVLYFSKHNSEQAISWDVITVGSYNTK